MIEDIDCIPTELKAKSLSDKEIALKYDDVLQVIDFLSNEAWAICGWEGWLRYSDGRVGHSGEFQGIVTIKQTEKESWQSYVERTASLCHSTIDKAQHFWNMKPEVNDAELFYCLVAIIDGKYNDWNFGILKGDY